MIKADLRPFIKHLYYFYDPRNGYWVATVAYIGTSPDLKILTGTVDIVWPPYDNPATVANQPGAGDSGGWSVGIGGGGVTGSGTGGGEGDGGEGGSGGGGFDRDPPTTVETE